MCFSLVRKPDVRQQSTRSRGKEGALHLLYRASLCYSGCFILPETNFFGLTHVIEVLAEIESVVITGVEEVKRLSSNDKQMAGTGETVDTQQPHTAWVPFTCNGQN